jgi:hypothetical protein
MHRLVANMEAKASKMDQHASTLSRSTKGLEDRLKNMSKYALELEGKMMLSSSSKSSSSKSSSKSSNRGDKDEPGIKDEVETINSSSKRKSLFLDYNEFYSTSTNDNKKDDDDDSYALAVATTSTETKGTDTYSQHSEELTRLFGGRR